MEDKDYEYLLNRIWYKVQQVVKANHETAKNFYLVIDKSVKEEISRALGKKSQTNDNSKKIKNPVIIKPKGTVIFLLSIYLFYFILTFIYLFKQEHTSKKRNRSQFETTKPKPSKRLALRQQNGEIGLEEKNNTQGLNLDIIYAFIFNFF